MSTTHEYIIGVVYDDARRYYTGKENPKFTLKPDEAKRYGDRAAINEDLKRLAKDYVTRIVIEVQNCPKCHKDFVDIPALSREDNETEICPECGVREAVEAFAKAIEDKYERSENA